MSAPPTEPPRRPLALARAWPAIAVLAVGAAAYSNSFDVPLQFDDFPNIADATGVHAANLSMESLRRAGSGFPLNRWLVRTSFAADYALHGPRPAGYHAVNLALHLAAALLVFAIAARILAALGFGDEAGRRRAAAIAALLFTVHPVQTQAVTYVVQRMTVMGAAFALLAIWCWLLAREKAGAARRALRAGALLSAYAAFACKENFAVLPLLVLALEWVLDPNLAARIRARWKTFAAAGAVLVTAGSWAVSRYLPVIEAEHARLGVPVAHRLLTQGRVLVHYLSLILLPLPARLHVDYAYPPSTGLFEPWSTLPALFAIAALAVAAVALRRRAPLFALATAWFLVALAVEQTALPIDLVFEQRIYFAAIGFFVFAGAASVRWVRVPRVGAWAVAAPAIALLGAGTFARNERWRDPASLYADEVSSRPGAPRGLLTVAATLLERGDLDGAEKVLRRAIELDPRGAGAYVNLGSVELGRGHDAEAARWYRRALALDANHADAWFNLGLVLSREGEHLEAARAYENVLKIDPGRSDARVNLALLRHDGGNDERALADLDEALRIDPGSLSALENRAVIRIAVGRLDEAAADARRALERAPEEAFPHVVMAQVHFVAGRVSDARSEIQAALRIAPGDADARTLAAAIH